MEFGADVHRSVLCQGALCSVASGGYSRHWPETLRRIGRHLRRRGLLREDPEEEQDAEANLAVSAVSGQTPPGGPHWQVRLGPLERRPPAYDKPLCASQDGFSLHAATRAGALDLAGREALLRYVLRPPLAQDKIEPQPDGLIRIVLKKPYAG